MATGGMRRLEQQNHYGFMILRTAVIDYLQTCGFDDAQYNTISGEDEALYGWVAVNSVDEILGTAANTHGFMEMGGESAQFAVCLHGPDYGGYNGVLREVTIGDKKYRVFVKTWLGLGADSAWKRHEEKLRESECVIAHDPCLPKQFSYRLGGSDKIVLGTSDFVQCLKETFSLLSCPDKRCLAGNLCIFQSAGKTPDPQKLSPGCLLRDPITGKPFMQFDAEKFGGASVYWHAMHGIFGRHKGGDDFAKFWTDVQQLSATNWEQIRADKVDTPSKFVQNAFFTAGMVMSTLFYGFGIPMPLDARVETALMALERAKRSLDRAVVVAVGAEKKFNAAKRKGIVLMERVKKAEAAVKAHSNETLATKDDAEACEALYNARSNEQNLRDMIATMSWETGAEDELERKKEAAREARVERARASALVTETYSTWVIAKAEVREMKSLWGSLKKRVEDVEAEKNRDVKAETHREVEAKEHLEVKSEEHRNVMDEAADVMDGAAHVYSSVANADWPFGRIVLHANGSGIDVRSKHGWEPVVPSK